ncbi:MAG TPA: helix-hairpin-helix domain-containing protein [Tissierellaceae bacterium]|nr:helix-hairpin-helix domain-containing protein [Tissierellaceae bacterium]
MKEYFTKKEQIVILAVILVVVLFTGHKFITSNIIQEKEEPLELLNEDIILDEVIPNDDSIDEDTIIMVHISGQVYYPGLIELKSGSRVNDAIDLAGGLKKEADTDRINLAKKLVDEEKVHVPKKGEEIDIDVASISTNLTSSNEGRININTCSKEELMSLSGIGEVTATKIIDYRTTNQFRKIEDMMNVSGIGEKKFEAIKDFIIVK